MSSSCREVGGMLLRSQNVIDVGNQTWWNRALGAGGRGNKMQVTKARREEAKRGNEGERDGGKKKAKKRKKAAQARTTPNLPDTERISSSRCSAQKKKKKVQNAKMVVVRLSIHAENRVTILDKKQEKEE